MARMSWRRVSFADGRQCKGGGRFRDMLLVLFGLCGVSCLIWLLWGLDDYGISERKVRVRDLWNESDQMLLDQHNLNKDQLQALALLISSLDQVHANPIPTLSSLSFCALVI